MMSNFVNTIELLGDQATADAIVSRKITEFKDDVLTKIGRSRFGYCGQLTAVDLPNVTTIESSAFYLCSSLSSVNLPKVSVLQNYAFAECKALKFLDLPKAAQIGSAAFDLVKVEILILRSSAVCSLDSARIFDSSAHTIVYVPYDFIDAYENATNWSSLVSQGKVTFEALEGSGYD